MDEGATIAVELLENKSLTPEQSDAELLSERDAHFRPHRGAEEGVLLAEDLAIVLTEFQRDDLPGIRSGEGHRLFARSLVGEVGHEQTLAREHPLAHLLHFVPEAALGIRAVTHLGLELDTLVHVVHGARLGDDRLAGIKFDFDDLHLLADEGVINLMGGAVGWHRRNGRPSWNHGCHAGSEIGPHVLEGLPVSHAVHPHERGGGHGAGADERRDFGVVDDDGLAIGSGVVDLSHGFGW